MEENPYQSPENDDPLARKPRGATPGAKVAFAVITRAIGLWLLVGGVQNLLAGIYVAMNLFEPREFDWTIPEYFVNGASDAVIGCVLLFGATGLTETVFRRSDW